MAKFILDTRLSESHYVLCTEAIRQGVIEPDDLNEGRRTMAEQWHFFRNQPPLAAFPQPNAPHIWAGRQNHAIDANSFNGAARRLADFYEANGVDVSFNVPGENWHFQPASEAQLKNAAHRIRLRRDLEVSKPGESESRIKFFKHQLHFVHDPQTQRAYYRPGQPRPKTGYTDYFNDDLKKAVQAFQEDHNLKADGIIGPHTDKVIDEAYAQAKRKRVSARKRAEGRKAKVLRGATL
jgi:hypothetical protein